MSLRVSYVHVGARCALVAGLVGLNAPDQSEDFRPNAEGQRSTGMFVQRAVSCVARRGVGFDATRTAEQQRGASEKESVIRSHNNKEGSDVRGGLLLPLEVHTTHRFLILHVRIIIRMYVCIHP